MKLFTGNCTAIVTPMCGGYKRVDYDAFKKLIDRQIESKSEALVVLGTTGEASTLTEKERADVVKFAVNYVNKRMLVIAGAGSNNTAEAVKRSRSYEALGADALLHVTPYYNKSTQNGLIEHFSLIADSVNIPIILYNVPSRTGVNLLPHTVHELSKHRNISGVKEASGNIEQIEEIIRLCEPNFYVYSGDDSLTIPTLSIGGRGVISVLGNIAPKEVNQMCNYFFESRVLEAMELQLKYLPLIKLLFCEVNPIPTKAALNLMGLDAGVLRLPLTELTKENGEKLEQELKKLKLI